MSIVRTQRSSEFTVIPNAVINDERLKGDQLGLLVYLLSKPSDWWIKIDSLKTNGRFGSHGKIVKDLKHLRDIGYAHLTRLASGKTEWVITDHPFSFKENQADSPHSENRNMAASPATKPHSENPNGENPNGENRNVLQRTDLDKELISDKELIGTPPRKAKFSAADMPEIDADLANEFIAYRKAKRSPIGPTAWKLIKSEAVKAGWPVSRAVEETMARGWQGFKAEWVNKPSGGRYAGVQPIDNSAPAKVARAIAERDAQRFGRRVQEDGFIELGSGDYQAIPY